MQQFTNRRFLESEAFPFHAGLYSTNEARLIKPHSHEFVELVYIVKGEGYHSYKGLVHRIQSGDAFIIEPGIVHSYQIDAGHSLSMYNILFLPSLVSGEIEQLSSERSFFDFYYVVPFMKQLIPDQPSLWLAIAEQKAFRRLLDEIVQEYARKEPGYRSMIRSKLVECFVILSRCSRRSPSTATLVGDHSRQTMEQLADFVKYYCEKQLTLQEMSRLSGMGISTFTAKFKQHTGRTFLEYRNEMRIHMAKELLKATDRKTVDIAGQVGFDDLSQFNKTFRKYAGMSPSEYRKSNT